MVEYLIWFGDLQEQIIADEAHDSDATPGKDWSHLT